MEDSAGRTTMRQVLDAGFSASLVQMLVSQGTVVQETRGVYALADTMLDDFAVIELRWPKVVFSYTSSLYLHGLIDLVPSFLEVSLPQKYKADKLLEEFPDCKVHPENLDVYELGVEEIPSPTGTLVRTHDLERSICDLVLARKRGEADPSIIGKALNEYFSRGDKNLARLARYAKALGIEKDVATYLEVLG